VVITVFTNGCFDILHVGHIQYLEQSRALGDRLIVGLNSDDSVRRLKGPTRPVNSQDDRRRMLKALHYIDTFDPKEGRTTKRNDDLST
jgi:rfaE bifunctional protein nucleotidyltransferase chain/domain